MNEKKYTKLSRLYIDIKLSAQANIQLPEAQSHYLKNVMRRKDGEQLRLFNAADGEWLAEITQISKKSVNVKLHEQLRIPHTESRELHLIFSPIKKDRMDFLIEKATEIGATHLHPAIMANTQLSKIKPDRLEKQIISAAEQCERLDIPVINSIRPLQEVINSLAADIKIFAALERRDNLASLQNNNETNCAFLAGPEGGFDDDEMQYLHTHEKVTPVQLGKNILRAETAVCVGLALLNIK